MKLGVGWGKYKEHHSIYLGAHRLKNVGKITTCFPDRCKLEAQGSAVVPLWFLVLSGLILIAAGSRSNGNSYQTHVVLHCLNTICMTVFFVIQYVVATSVQKRL